MLLTRNVIVCCLQYLVNIPVLNFFIFFSPRYKKPSTCVIERTLFGSFKNQIANCCIDFIVK